MTYTTNTSILGPSKGDPKAIIAWLKAKGCKRPDEVEKLINTFAEFAPQFGIRFEVPVALCLQECSLNGVPFANSWWIQNLNAGSIGVTGDPVQNAASRTFPSGRECALAILVHLYIYAKGATLPATVAKYQSEDWRFQAVKDAGWVGIAPTLKGLSNRWAADPIYDVGIAAHLNAMDAAGLLTGTNTTNPPQGETTVSDTVGKIVDILKDVTGKKTELNFDPKLVPLPKHDVDYAWNKVENVGTNFMGPRTFRGNTFHRCLSDGQSFEGAVDWLLRASTAGLADAFIDHRTGQMRFINPMRALASTFSFKMDPNWEDQAGWTNGPYQEWLASDDAKAFVAAYGDRLGANIINQDCENVEVTGDYDDDISDACKATLVQWQASRAQFLKIPYSSYPINPATGLTVIYGHREWCGTDYKLCPGSVLWAFMNGPMIGLVQAKLKVAQTSSIAVTPSVPTKPVVVPSIYEKPILPAWLKGWSGAPTIPNVPDVAGDVFATTTQYVALRDTRRRQSWLPDSKDVGPKIKGPVGSAKGEDFDVAFTLTSQKDGKEYGVTWYGTVVDLADLKVVGENALKAA